MKRHGISNRCGAAIVQVRRRVAQAPERRRAPVELVGSARLLGLVFGDSLRFEHRVRPGITQLAPHVVEQKIAINAVHVAELRPVADRATDTREQLAFAALGHNSEPKLTEDPIITTIAKRVNKTPAQVLLAWAIQRGTALLTTSKTPSRIKENVDVSALPAEAVREISEGIKTQIRFNAVVETGVPGFIPREKRV